MPVTQAPRPRRLLAALLLATLIAGCSSSAPTAAPPSNPGPAPTTAPGDKPGAGGQNPPTQPVSTQPGGGGTTATPAEPSLHLPMPSQVRGIYLTGWTAGSPDRLKDEIAYLEANHLNTFVIDIKDDDGRISFPMPGTQADALNANAGKIGNPKQLIEDLHAKHIYVIARQVVMADPYLARKHPEWAIHQDGQLYRDERGVSWIDPKSDKVWDYNIEIAVYAAKLGFDEIQFDYIRLPAHRLKGYNDSTTSSDQREEPVTAFLTRATRAIHDQAHVPVSADVFAIDAVAVDPVDEFIGQNYVKIAHAVDIISPMAYPSLYAKGEFGIPNPNARPYDTVWQTMTSAWARTADLPLKNIRPWLQDYDLGEPHYGPKEVAAQIEAIASLGIGSFMLWNARNRFTDGVDFSVADKTPLAVSSARWLGALYNLITTYQKVRLPKETGVPEGQYTSVVAAATHDAWQAELHGTERPQPSNSDAARAGQLRLAVASAASEAGLPQPPEAAQANAIAESVALGGGVSGSLVPTAGGVLLTWQAEGQAWRIWAPARDAAVAAANSMEPVRLLQGR